MRTSWWIAVLAGAGVGIWLLSRSNKYHSIISPDSLAPWRRTMLDTAHKHADLQTPYQWGGGRSSTNYGVDCSGLVLQAMRAAGIPDPKQGWTAEAYYEAFEPVTQAQPADLAFYGAGTATHVVIVDEAQPGDTEMMIVGANGGGPNILTAADAATAKAFVRRDRLAYRSDFLGFRSLEKYVAETSLPVA